MMSSVLTRLEAGMLRIYLKPNDLAPGKPTGIFRQRSLLYHQLVLAAKASGITNAHAHHTHFGYSNHGNIQQEIGDMPNPHLTLCVELICDRDKLESFCEHYANLLEGKVIVYKPLERWIVTAAPKA
ncbi:MAG: DUF190 domain-containing protein [Asticcacaulis sp.]